MSDNLPIPWLTVEQTAEYLQLCQQTVRRYVRDGRLQAVKLAGQKIRISAASIEKLLNEPKQ